ncbi:MAG: hypothetical protein DSZ24_01980 [Thermodesulfatator sp.]|nr:MAG: hypothetical protein DSZ24_01980 [Thermodesulfatator sp.]
MLKKALIVSNIFLFCCWIRPLFGAHCGVSRERAPETARYLALFFASGWEAIAKYPQGDLKEKIQEELVRLSGKSLEELPPESQKVLQEALKAVEIALFLHQRGDEKDLPRLLGRQIEVILAFRCGIRVKQPSLRFRDPYNRPDPWEKRFLEKFEVEVVKDRRISAKGSLEDSQYRYLYPLWVHKSCLRCHGGPQGSRDITGHLREGYRERDLRGAVSVVLPVY